MADQNDSPPPPPTSRPRSVQRGRTSPSHALEDAIDGVRRVFESLGATRHSRDDASQAMGYKPGSGAANSRVGSLTHFGLLERHGASYQVSALARRILEPTDDAERQAAVAEAASTPSLYAELLAELDGEPFPPMLANILSRNYGVVPKNAEEVANRFQESLRFAGLLRDGKVQASLSIDSGGIDQSALPDSNVELHPPRSPRSERQDPPTDSSVGAGYRIPLKQGREAVLHLPRPSRRVGPGANQELAGLDGGCAYGGSG
jgi:hypothetical protein